MERFFRTRFFLASESMNAMAKSYAIGDWVVYTQRKQSSSPGPRAKNINPSQHGELYSYQVDKFWVVAGKNDASELTLKTRRSKTHVVRSDDICLRKAHWWERFFLRTRFPSLESTSTSASVAV